MTQPAKAIKPSATTLTAGKDRSSRFQIGEFGWIWIATGILFAASAVLAPGTVRVGALLSMLPFAAILSIVAMGQTVVIQQRGLDMSVAALVALGGVMAAKIGTATDSVFLAVVVTLLAALVLGTINGILVARLNIMPIVATLASNALFLGIVRVVSGNMVIPTPTRLTEVVSTSVLGIPASVWLALLLIALVTVVIRVTRIGRCFVIVGANPRAARAAGIRVLWFQIGTYAFASVCFAGAGILLAGTISSASHLAGPEYLLPGIAAVVVGGTAFAGGKGSIVASGVAAVFIEQLAQLVLSMGAGTAGQLLVQALAIIVATTLQHLSTIAAFFRRRG